MTSLASKLSSYNIFNYLFPGSLFCYFLYGVFGVKLFSGMLIIDFFSIYFLGLVISRIGSLIISPIIHKFFKFDSRPYSDFVKACKEDDKVELLSEVNNTYRNLLSLCIIVFVVCCSSIIVDIFNARNCPFGQDVFFKYIEDNKYVINSLWGSLIMAVIFVFSNKKQSKYVVKRIDEVVKCKIIMK